MSIQLQKRSYSNIFISWFGRYILKLDSDLLIIDKNLLLDKFTSIKFDNITRNVIIRLKTNIKLRKNKVYLTSNLELIYILV